MGLKVNLLVAIWVIAACHWPKPASGQRSLLHWKRDLEYRLGSYQNQRDTISNILSSSIYPGRDSLNGPALVTSGGNVRFSDLIIPTGSLVLDSHIAQPIVKIMINKTLNYVGSKMNELYQIRNQLDMVKRQIEDPSQQFIYKGLPGVPSAYVNSTRIAGTRLFKQFTYGHMIDAKQIDLMQVNFTNVDHVMNETYMDNPQFDLLDSESRLYFEGRKTFWRSVFVKQLKSGCCDRLKPLHTNRMMTRTTNQDILAPVWFHTNDPYNMAPVVIRQLTTSQLYNRVLAIGTFSNKPDDNGLVPTPPENLIQLHNLINMWQQNQPDILKTLVFRDVLAIDEARLHTAQGDQRLLIGVASTPGLQFDLSHDDYLLKFSTVGNSSFVQRVVGSVIINSQTHFASGVNAEVVNRVPNFRQFVADIVRIDRPAAISGPVRFNAMPMMFSNPASASRAPQNVVVMLVNGQLDAGLVNGLQIPNDIVVLPQTPNGHWSNSSIRVRGPRLFTNQLVFNDLVYVRQLVNGIEMPAAVIPLHLNDFVDSVGTSNLWFLDGIIAGQITVQSGQFDDINIRGAYGDAQHLIMRSVHVPQADGSHLITAPLQVLNLRLIGDRPDQALLNGFKPHRLLELSKLPVDSIGGKKTFRAHVEATDCLFTDINNLANWTNHLIRVDRPNTVQTIHTKLAFLQPVPPQVSANPAYLAPYNPTSSVQIENFVVEFYPNNNRDNYLSNLNFSPEFYILQQALLRGAANHTEGRYRVLDQVRLLNPQGRINGVSPADVVTLDHPFRFAGRFVMVGKTEVQSTLRASRITSNYPIDAMDIEQFNKYRIPIAGSLAPILLNSLVLATNNRASFLQCRLLNGVPFSEFANSIMSLTRPQLVDTSLVFRSPVNLEGLVRTESAVNGVKSFRQFAGRLKSAKYSFENGLQCNTVMIKV